jgi:hypothetical protein
VFIVLQLVGLAIAGTFPSLVNYLPNRVYLSSDTAPPPMNPKLQHCLEDYVFDQYDRNGDEILGHIAENDAINLLVVGAAPPDQGRGSLISWLAGQLAGQLNIPLVVVPGSLSDQQLQDLT